MTNTYLTRAKNVLECVLPYTVWVCVSCVGVEEILCGVTLTRRESSLGFNLTPGGSLGPGCSDRCGQEFPDPTPTWKSPSTVSTPSTTIKTRRRGCFVRLRRCLSITRSQRWWFGGSSYLVEGVLDVFWHGLGVVNCWWTQCPGGGGGVGTVGSIKNTNVVPGLFDLVPWWK